MQKLYIVTGANGHLGTAIIKQLQVRYLIDDYNSANNYNKLSYRNIELTSRIPNEKIKKKRKI